MYKNHEGYPDPAAGAAIREADRPPEDYRKTVRMMLFTAKCMGYHVEDTIRLRAVSYTHLGDRRDPCAVCKGTGMDASL